MTAALLAGEVIEMDDVHTCRQAGFYAHRRIIDHDTVVGRKPHGGRCFTVQFRVWLPYIEGISAEQLTLKVMP